MAAPQLRLLLSESKVNLANNTSVVTATLQLYGNGETYSNNREKGYIILDGTRYDFVSTFSASRSWQTLAAYSKTITHKDDGSYRVSVKGYFDISWSYYGALSTSNSLLLSTIPRASIPTTSPTTIDGGGSVVIATHRKSTAFIHTLRYKFGKKTGIIAEKLETDMTWTVPLDLLNEIPKTLSGTCTIYCDTYNGAKLIGTKTVDLTINVPKTVVPTIASITHSEAVIDVKNAFNQYAKGLSQLNIVIQAAGVYSSEITSYETEIDGVRYIQQQFTSNVIGTAGTMPIKVTVTDSRGRTATKTVNVSVSDYFKPYLDNISIEQCNADGTHNNTGLATKVSFKGAVASVNNSNKKVLIVKWKKLTDVAYQSKTVPIDWMFNTFTIIPWTIYDESYEFIVVVSDKLSSFEQKVENGRTALSLLAGGKGIRMFGEAEREGFWIDNTRYDLAAREQEKLISMTGENVLNMGVLLNLFADNMVEFETINGFNIIKFSNGFMIVYGLRTTQEVLRPYEFQHGIRLIDRISDLNILYDNFKTIIGATGTMTANGCHVAGIEKLNGIFQVLIYGIGNRNVVIKSGTKYNLIVFGTWK